MKLKVDAKTAIAAGWPILKVIVKNLWGAYKRTREDAAAQEAREEKIAHAIDVVWNASQVTVRNLGGLLLSWKASGWRLTSREAPSEPGRSTEDGERTFDEVSEPVWGALETIVEHTKAIPFDEPGDREIVVAGVVAKGIHELAGEDDVMWLPGNDTKFLVHLIKAVVSFWRARRAAGVVAAK